MSGMVRNFERRGKDSGGIDSLIALQQVADQVEETMAKLVHFLLSEEGGSYSWEQVAEALGITKQGARKRSASGIGARKPGGQPAHLR
jgi:hypothetical protein